MKIRRSCKISLTLLGLSTLFLSGCDNRPSLEQKQAWLLEQEAKAADNLTPQDREAAEWEYNNWTPEEKRLGNKRAVNEVTRMIPGFLGGCTG